MKKQFITFLMSCALGFTAFAQTTFTLDVIAEGNFGTDNADVFRRNTTVSPATTSGGVYQAANSTTGFDVLQDFVVLGDKAIFAEKPAGVGRVVIADYPSLTEVHTFLTSDAPQGLKFVSPTKAYVSMGNPGDLRLIDLTNNTMTSVIDPSNNIYSYSNHMEYANGVLYAALGSTIVKVDTATNTVTGTIAPNIGSIKGLVYEEVDDKLWVLNGSGSLISVDIANSDVLGSTIATGASSTKLLREYNEQLYFWSSNKNMYIYNINTPASLPLSASYTSTLPGASFAFAYGRSFDIDQNSGDFAICSANSFSAPGHYEVVDGNSFTVIEAGNIPGCAIPNKCIIKTFDAVVAPVPDLDSLPVIAAECSVELIAPTANGNTITATTDSLSYTVQGTYEVVWTYDNGSATVTQTQTVVIDDTTSPVEYITVLDTVKVECNEEITFVPYALDNCADTIYGTTTDDLVYSTDGEYTIEWTYADGNGNTTTQNLMVVVECKNTNVGEFNVSDISLFPNPAKSILTIDSKNIALEKGCIVNGAGQKVKLLAFQDSNLNQIDVSALPNGIYMIQLILKNGEVYGQKISIQK
ncbi:MAG: T9SS type A sorting domain-containing protein [Flavobacteriales bacterium]